MGLSGVGAEIAKNLCCAGAQAITLVDDDFVEERDLGTNMLLSATDVGARKAAACAARLARMNPQVKVVCESDLKEDVVAVHDTMVYTRNGIAVARGWLPCHGHANTIHRLWMSACVRARAYDIAILRSRCALRFSCLHMRCLPVSACLPVCLSFHLSINLPMAAAEKTKTMQKQGDQGCA